MSKKNASIEFPAHIIIFVRALDNFNNMKIDFRRPCCGLMVISFTFSCRFKAFHQKEKENKLWINVKIQKSAEIFFQIVLTK